MEYVFIVLAIIGVGLLIYLGFTHLIKNKQFQTSVSSCVDIEALIEALGGIKNIKEVGSSPSKLTVKLENTNVDIAKIQSLGASGIVEGHQTLAMIFGKQSVLIAEDLLKRM